MLRKNILTLGESETSTEGAHSRRLPQWLEMPPCGIMFDKMKENIIKEGMPHTDSFNRFYLWQYRRPVCGMQLQIAMGVSDEYK
ncbi:hypothetical protein Ana3638_04305 [Anaerocolumna sedimenticola]|uniref:Uncharacterized protein n=1 Tax=Anaerocolumna sedimenticola TaxID=2696063 RepID=A0A6P1TJ32_9FIRM|nr:hypothetical protein [Anaerocolumna sedimenticola]QHQ60102.1 hypothetical protein Ana3638_04305 [Anaerocolumna sedimenticola]